MKTTKIYRMDQAKFPRERMTILRLYWGTVLLLSIGAIVFISLRKLPLAALWWLPLIVALLLYYMANAVRSTQRNFDEYTLEWDGETVKQNMPDMPEMVLDAAEITQVELTRQGLELSTRAHRNLLTISGLLSEADLAELKRAISHEPGSTQI